MLDPELRPDAATEGSVPEDKILANRNTLAASAAVDDTELPWGTATQNKLNTALLQQAPRGGGGGGAY